MNAICKFFLILVLIFSLIAPLKAQELNTSEVLFERLSVEPLINLTKSASNVTNINTPYSSQLIEGHALFDAQNLTTSGNLVNTQSMELVTIGTHINCAGTNATIPLYDTQTTTESLIIPLEYNLSGVVSSSESPGKTDVQSPAVFTKDPVTGQEYVADQVIVRYNTKKFQSPGIMNAYIKASNEKIGAKVEKDFSAERMVEQIVDLYHEVAGW